MEIDFVIETRKRTVSSKPGIICIEIKSSGKWQAGYERHMRELKASGNFQILKMYGVYTGARAYFNGNITVLPVGEFLAQLHKGKIF